MTIDEAIKELTEPYNERQLIVSPRFMEALQLGIEALKREREYRPTREPRTFDFLPGETEE